MPCLYSDSDLDEDPKKTLYIISLKTQKIVEQKKLKPKNRFVCIHADREYDDISWENIKNKLEWYHKTSQNGLRFYKKKSDIYYNSNYYNIIIIKHDNQIFEFNQRMINFKKKRKR